MYSLARNRPRAAKTLLGEFPMALRQLAKQLLPERFLDRLRARRSKRFDSIETLACDSSHLTAISEVDLNTILDSEKTLAQWNESLERLNTLSIPENIGGVNPGDQRAIFYLINHFRPDAVLEVGTFIGASTVHIAEALSGSREANRNSASLTTVDINDVNDVRRKPWIQHGATHSPRELLDQLGLSDLVQFVNRPSLAYLAACEEKFDLIFLDGDHSAEAVYREIPAALELLNPGGVILLHDYFTDQKPLWSNEHVIPGPFLAANRFRNEGANLSVLPLGELPWPTKLGSNMTSLALLLRSH
jgi:predicted O-methyltransferase YrrM